MQVLLGLEWSYPCDMWSVGCILLELLEGEITFDTLFLAQVPPDTHDSPACLPAFPLSRCPPASLHGRVAAAQSSRQPASVRVQGGKCTDNPKYSAIKLMTLPPRSIWR